MEPVDELTRLRLHNRYLLAALRFTLSILDEFQRRCQYVPHMGSAMREARNTITMVEGSIDKAPTTEDR